MYLYIEADRVNIQEEARKILFRPEEVFLHFTVQAHS